MATLLQAIRDAWDTGDTAQIQRLLEAGGQATASAKDPGTGVTPLIEAARWGHAETLTLLLSKGAEVNEPDHNGRAPLYVAAAVGHEEAVCVLLAAGATADSFTNTHWTALHAAADRGHEGAVGVLLKNGASTSVVSATGHTPRDLAREKRHRATVLLFDSMANYVLLLVSAQQRLAWALGSCAGTQGRPSRGWTVAPDLVWSVGSLLATAPSWMIGWPRLLAQVGRQATEESSDCDARRGVERWPFDLSTSSRAILAAEVARVERAAQLGSLQRRDRQAIRLGCE